MNQDKSQNNNMKPQSPTEEELKQEMDLISKQNLQKKYPDRFKPDQKIQNKLQNNNMNQSPTEEELSQKMTRIFRENLQKRYPDRFNLD